MENERVEEISKGLSSENPKERLKAVNKLTEIAVDLNAEDRKEVVKLLSSLAKDKEPFIRWNVAIALGKIGHKDAIPILEKMANDMHANVRFRVVRSLENDFHPDYKALEEFKQKIRIFPNKVHFHCYLALHSRFRQELQILS